jgi:protein-disulfide isomerase
MESLLERIALVFALGAGVLVVALAIRRANTRRIADIRRRAPDWRALGVTPDGRRTVVAFSSPSCAACRSAQWPAIERARAELADFAVRRIDVDTARQPDAARAFGVLTVPATVIIGATGTRIVAVNQGFTSSARLVEQLRAS